MAGSTTGTSWTMVAAATAWVAARMALPGSGLTGMGRGGSCSGAGRPAAGWHLSVVGNPLLDGTSHATPSSIFVLRPFSFPCRHCLCLLFPWEPTPQAGKATQAMEKTLERHAGGPTSRTTWRPPAKLLWWGPMQPAATLLAAHRRAWLPQSRRCWFVVADSGWSSSALRLTRDSQLCFSFQLCYVVQRAEVHTLLQSG